MQTNLKILEAPTSESTLPVPASYAEKAMASLMRLHGELMDEKEKRVDLYRRLMEKEQALAELRMYVQLLEEKLEQPSSAGPAFQDERFHPARPPPATRTPAGSTRGKVPDAWRSW